MLTLRSAFLMLFICLPSHADPVQLEQQVFNLGTSVKSLLLKYYHVQADEGNGELIMDLDRRLQQTQQNHASIQNSLGGRYLKQSQNIKTHWSAFNQHLSANLSEIRESAFPELQVVTLMREAANAMVLELDNLALLVAQDNELQLSASQNWARQQTRLLQQVVERYIERAASSMGAPLSVDGPQLPELMASFKQGLELFPQGKAGSDASRSLSRIKGQWLFIEKSAQDQSARLVPYLVMRYTDSILNRLQQLAS